MSNANIVHREKCPACGSSQSSILYKKLFSETPIKEYLINFYSSKGTIDLDCLKDANYSLSECESCSLIFQEETLNNNLMKKLYQEWIDPQNNEQDTLRYFSKYAQEVMQIVAFFNRNPSSLSFFDFGMGLGRWALMVKAFGCNSYGAELAIEQIEFAKSNGIKIVMWDEIPDQQFDFINTEQVFEHIQEPLKTILHLKKALKKGGIIKISVPTAIDIKRRLKIMDWRAAKGSKNSLNPVAPLEHINFFRRKSLCKMAEIAGLKEVMIPLKIQYQFTTMWKGIMEISKNLAIPIYRNIMKRQNYMFFQNG